MRDLDNLDEAQNLIEGLLPDSGIRLLCLNLFMDAIKVANSYGSEQWYVEPAFDGHVWLITGHLVTCSLVEDRIWLSLDRRLMASQAGKPLICDGTDLNWNWEPVDLDDPTWVHDATVINGFYTPAQNHHQIWPQIRRLLFETIYQSIMASADYIMPKVHSPGIVACLQQETGRKIR